MKTQIKQYAGVLLAGTVVVGGIASAAITPAFPTISDTFAVAGQVIKSADVNKLAEAVNNLDKRAFQIGTSAISFLKSDGTARTAGQEITVTDDGKVGIGTVSPSSKLVIADTQPDLRLEHTDSTSYSRLKFFENTTNIASIQAIGSNFSSVDRQKDLEIRSDVGGDVVLQQNGGNVGIGTTTPGAKLDIDGDLKIKASLNIKGVGGTTAISFGDNAYRGVLYSQQANCLGSDTLISVNGNNRLCFGVGQ